MITKEDLEGIETITTEEETPTDKEQISSKQEEEKKEEVKEEVKEEDNDKEENKEEEEDVLPVIKKTRKSRAKDRIQRLNRRLREREQELEELRKKLSEYESKKQEVKKIEPPDINDFDDTDEYLEALAKYEEQVKQEKEEVKQEPVKQEVNTPFSNSEYRRIEEILKEGLEIYGDKFNKVQDDSLPLSVPVLKEVIQFPDAADILYYLAHKRNELKEISSLNNKYDIRYMLEMISHKLDEDKEEAKAKKKVSNAPEPINVVKGDTYHNGIEAEDFDTFEKEYLKLKQQNTNW